MKKNNKLFTIIKLVLIPVLIGLILYLITDDSTFLEVVLVVFGLSELIIFVRRNAKREKKNMKKTGTFKNNKRADDYKVYSYRQSIILISALINLALSYLSFLLLGA